MSLGSKFSHQKSSSLDDVTTVPRPLATDPVARSARYRNVPSQDDSTIGTSLDGPSSGTGKSSGRCFTPGCPAASIFIKPNGFCVDCNLARRADPISRSTSGGSGSTFTVAEKLPKASAAAGLLKRGEASQVAQIYATNARGTRNDPLKSPTAKGRAPPRRGDGGVSFVVEAAEPPAAQLPPAVPQSALHERSSAPRPPPRPHHNASGGGVRGGGCSGAGRAAEARAAVLADNADHLDEVSRTGTVQCPIAIGRCV